MAWEKRQTLPVTSQWSTLGGYWKHSTQKFQLEPLVLDGPRWCIWSVLWMVLGSVQGWTPRHLLLHTQTWMRVLHILSEGYSLIHTSIYQLLGKQGKGILHPAEESTDKSSGKLFYKSMGCQIYRKYKSQEQFLLDGDQNVGGNWGHGFRCNHCWKRLIRYVELHCLVIPKRELAYFVNF